MKPMLAKDAVPEKIKYPVAAQDKIDGIRVVVVDGEARSRTLKSIQNAEIQAALGRSEFNGLDGEVVVGDPTAADAYRCTASFVMAPNKTGEPWCFYVFDKWDECGVFTERWEAAADSFYELSSYSFMRMLGYRLCEDEAALLDFEADRVARGHEGIIVRDPNGLYKFGRSSVTKGELLKLKRFADFEAEVIGAYEELHNANEAVTNALGRTERSSIGANRHGKGTLGGLIVRGLNGPFEGVEFSVGTGFDASQRATYWQSPEILGAIAKIKYFPIGVKDKPRHPVFLGLRDKEDL